MTIAEENERYLRQWIRVRWYRHWVFPPISNTWSELGTGRILRRTLEIGPLSFSVRWFLRAR